MVRKGIRKSKKKTSILSIDGKHHKKFEGMDAHLANVPEQQQAEQSEPLAPTETIADPVEKKELAEPLVATESLKEPIEIKKPGEGGQSLPFMVNLVATIHDVGRISITVPANKVDETLEKIWREGFKQKMQSRQRPYQIYGPHMIDKIDIEPIR